VVGIQSILNAWKADPKKGDAATVVDAKGVEYNFDLHTQMVDGGDNSVAVDQIREQQKKLGVSSKVIDMFWPKV